MAESPEPNAETGSPGGQDGKKQTGKQIFNPKAFSLILKIVIYEILATHEFPGLKIFHLK